MWYHDEAPSAQRKKRIGDDHTVLALSAAVSQRDLTIEMTAPAMAHIQ